MDIDPSRLTFEAEELGERPGASEPLLKLLTHDSPLVREGAVDGLANHMKMIIDRMRQVQQQDSSKGVRQAIEDALDWVSLHL